MGLAASPGYTPREYLELERSSDRRHEFLDGEIVAMSGASRDHNRIARNVVMSLEGQLRREGRCEAWVSDLRIKVDDGFYTYPDVVVACGDPRFEDSQLDTLLDPTLIVEVLSPSTEAYDRGEKWRRYRQLPSLSAYLLVDQGRPHVEHFRRAANEEWVLSEKSDLDSILALPSIDCRLPLAEIYRRVAFDPRSARLQGDGT